MSISSSIVFLFIDLNYLTAFFRSHLPRAGRPPLRGRGDAPPAAAGPPDAGGVAPRVPVPGAVAPPAAQPLHPGHPPEPVLALLAAEPPAPAPEG